MEKENEEEVKDSNELSHTHITSEQSQMVGVDLMFFTELLQMRTDYERLINVIIDNTRINYEDELVISSTSDILDYLKLTIPKFEKIIQFRKELLKKEEEE